MSRVTQFATSSASHFPHFHGQTGCTRRCKPCFHNTVDDETRSPASFAHHVPFITTPAIVVLDGLDAAVHETFVYRPKAFDSGCTLVLTV